MTTDEIYQILINHSEPNTLHSSYVMSNRFKEVAEAIEEGMIEALKDSHEEGWHEGYQDGNSDY